MRLLATLVLAVLVPACSEPPPGTEEESSSSSSGDASSSGEPSEESSTTGCDVTEHGWCTETCILPSGPEVVGTVGPVAGNVCSVVSHIVVSLDDCRTTYDCYQVVAELYGGGTITYEPQVGVEETVELWEAARLWFEASAFYDQCVALEPSCEVVSYEGCMEATRGLEGSSASIDEWRDYTCREIASRYPAAGLPPEDWPD